MAKETFLLRYRRPGAWRILVAALCVSSPFLVPSRACAADAAASAAIAALERPMFGYFWDGNADPRTGLIPDRVPSSSYSSIAGIGFELTAYVIGAQRHYIPRTASSRAIAVGSAHRFRTPMERGLLYHYIDLNTLVPTWDADVFPVDNSFLFGGIVAAESYFDGPSAPERGAAHSASSGCSIVPTGSGRHHAGRESRWIGRGSGLRRL